MPLLFKQHVDDQGEAYYTCNRCHTDLVLASDLISDEFRSGSNKAALFKNVINVDRGELHDRDMTTGMHTIQTIFCNGCQKEVGWCYVKAADKINQYKEGNFILVMPDVSLHKHRGGAENLLARKRKRSGSGADGGGGGSSSEDEQPQREGEHGGGVSVGRGGAPVAGTGSLRAHGSLLSRRSHGSSDGSNSSGSSGASSDGQVSRSSVGSHSSFSLEDEAAADRVAASASAALPASTAALLQRLNTLRRILGANPLV